MDSKCKEYKTGTVTVLERYPCGRETAKDEVPFITYTNVIVKKSSSFLEMNYHVTLILVIAPRN